jgi:predicted acyltransferase
MENMMSNALEVNPAPRRALSLDALRGLAILMMVFASSIPFGVLPSWMYHAQEPPPLHTFNPALPGITWVDLVFPFFLFAMGAAIPLAVSRKLQKGVKPLKAFGAIVYRGLLLAGFAIYINQINPHTISANPDWRTWIVALTGFVFLFPVLARLPGDWTPVMKYIIRAIGWTGAIALMIMLRLPDGSRFSLYSSDIIILVLSNVAVFGGAIWMASRENWLLRLGFLGVLLAIRMSSTSMGWVHSFWHYSPVEWLFQFKYLQYLFIIIPGTIAGDLILKWMNASRLENEEITTWRKGRLISIAALMILIAVEVVTGMKIRLVFPTFILSLVLCSAGLWLTQISCNSTENFIKTIFRWGVYWLILGFIFESFEGGIKKDPSTLSYYFITSGLAVFALIFFTIIIDIFKRRKIFGLLIHGGQNPMVAYAGLNNLVIPLLSLTKLSILLNILTPTPWLGVLGGAFITYLVALSAAFTAKRKIFLRT